jgi:hypothetical protein
MNRPTANYAPCDVQGISTMTTKRVQRPSVLIVDGVPARGGGGSASS